MKRKFFALFLASTFSFSSHAAIPPQYQRTVEFKAIFSDINIADSFPKGHFVDRVEYVKHDLYRVSAGQCFLYAKIKEKPLPDGMVGRRQFDLEIDAANCPPDQ